MKKTIEQCITELEMLVTHLINATTQTNELLSMQIALSLNAPHANGTMNTDTADSIAQNARVGRSTTTRK